MLEFPPQRFWYLVHATSYWHVLTCTPKHPIHHYYIIITSSLHMGNNLWLGIYVECVHVYKRKGLYIAVAMLPGICCYTQPNSPSASVLVACTPNTLHQFMWENKILLHQYLQLHQFYRTAPNYSVCKLKSTHLMSLLLCGECSIA